jgi:hypothetical protein
MRSMHCGPYLRRAASILARVLTLLAIGAGSILEASADVGCPSSGFSGQVSL